MSIVRQCRGSWPAHARASALGIVDLTVSIPKAGKIAQARLKPLRYRAQAFSLSGLRGPLRGRRDFSCAGLLPLELQGLEEEGRFAAPVVRRGCLALFWEVARALVGRTLLLLVPALPPRRRSSGSVSTMAPLNLGIAGDSSPSEWEAQGPHGVDEAASSLN